MWIDDIHKAEVYESKTSDLREGRTIINAYVYDSNDVKQENHVATLYYNEGEDVPDIGDIVEVKFETGGWVRVK